MYAESPMATTLPLWQIKSTVVVSVLQQAENNTREIGNTMRDNCKNVAASITEGTYLSPIGKGLVQ